MKNLLLLLLVGLVSALQAQFTITSGSHITVSSNSLLTVVELDVDLQTGGTLTNQGILYTNNTFTTTGTLATEIGGTTAGTDYGRVTADGGAALGGTLNVSKTAAYSPTGVVSHSVVLTGARAGTFATENLPDTDWRMDYTATAAAVVFDVGLPVSWLSFTAEPQVKSVFLHWATAAEEDNDYFLVERQESSTGTWTAIGRVAARGNELNDTEYFFEDVSPPSAVQIPYRLRQVDYDGTYSFSPIKIVRFNHRSFQEAVYPNPSGGEIFFNVDVAKVAHLELYDGAGRLLVRQALNPGATDHHFAFPEKMAAGTYFLRLGDRLERIILRR